MRLIHIIISSLLVSCASIPVPTPYQQVGKFNKDLDKKNALGYKIHDIKNINLKMSSFIGSTKTSINTAHRYSIAAAIEDCLNKRKIPVLLKTKNITRTDKRIGAYSTGGYKIGDYSVPVTTNIYDYDVTTPAYVTIYQCRKSVKGFNPKYSFNNINAELLQDYIADFKGGVLVASGDKNSKLITGDVILSVNGERVTNSFDLNELTDTEKDSLEFKIIRNRKIILVVDKLYNRREKVVKNVKMNIKTICESETNIQNTYSENESKISFCRMDKVKTNMSGLKKN